jgi:nitroreductase
MQREFMEIFEAITSRRTIHLGYYLDKPIPDSILRQVLEAGRWAPSPANNQPCHFLVIKDSSSRKWVIDHALEVLKLTAQIGRPPYREAQRKLVEYLLAKELVVPPVMIITLAEQDKRETHVYNHGGLHIMAASAAIQNMMLAAWALCLGSVWLTFYDDVRAKARFGIPTELDMVGIVLLGYPVRIPRVPASIFGFGLRRRYSLEQIVHQERFDEGKLEQQRRRDPYLHWIPEAERKKLVEEENKLVEIERKGNRAK